MAGVIMTSEDAGPSTAGRTAGPRVPQGPTGLGTSAGHLAPRRRTRSADITFDLPLPFRPHPRWRAAAERNHQWILQHELVNDETIVVYQKFELEKLVGYTYPDATDHGLDLANRIMSFSTLFDDQFDGPLGRMPDAARAVTDSFIELLYCPVTPDALAGSPLHRAFAEIWRDVCLERTPAWHTRATDSWQRYFSSLAHEAINRSIGTFLPLDCYLEQRVASGVMLPFTDASEMASGFELSPVAFHAPQIRVLRALAADFVDLSNDVVSLDKEIAVGEKDNLVLVIQQEQRCPLDEAISLAYHHVQGKIDRFAQLRAELRHTPRVPRDQRPLAARYVECLAAWMTGYEQWQRETPRYRSTADLTTQPGNGYRLGNLLEPRPGQGLLDFERALNPSVEA